MAIQDENVETVRRARESLLRKYRGLDGWFHHLEERDQERVVEASKRRRKRKRRPAVRE